MSVETAKQYLPDLSLTKVDEAFPARVSHLMPPYEEIPEEFLRGRNKWCDFQSDWFFHGVKNVKVKVKEGIDQKVAMRHLGCIQGSFEPRHEHKAAAVAYLASLWFDDIQYETVTCG